MKVSEISDTMHEIDVDKISNNLTIVYLLDSVNKHRCFNCVFYLIRGITSSPRVGSVPLLCSENSVFFYEVLAMNNWFIGLSDIYDQRQDTTVN